jgi:hypothetical protein
MSDCPQPTLVEFRQNEDGTYWAKYFFIDEDGNKCLVECPRFRTTWTYPYRSANVIEV